MTSRLDPVTIFSNDKYKCLDYHYIGSVNDSDKNLICDCIDDAILSLLAAIQYEHRIVEHDRSLRLELEEWGSTTLTKATGRNMDSLKPILGQAASCIEYFFPQSAHEYRLLMAKCTGTIITLDDYLTELNTREEVLQLQSRVWQGLPQKNDWCSTFVNLIATFATCYGSLDPLMGGLGASAWSGFINGFFQEERLRMRPPIYLPTRRDESKNGHSGSGDGEIFPWFLRSQSGAPIPFIIALFEPSRAVEVPLHCWMEKVPDLITFINLGNDLLSFRKEVLNNENENYVALFTQIKRESGQISRFHCDGTLWTVRDTVCDIFERVLKSIRMLDQSFNSPPHSSQEENLQVASKLWKEFKNGYVAWHINCSRYRLEVLSSLLMTSCEDNRYI
jgi:hypothetical protein